MARFVYTQTEIFLLPGERAEAQAAMREAGITSLPILEGEPGTAGSTTGETLEADGPSPTVADLPGDAEIAEMLSVLINPESGEDERMDVIGGLTQLGRVEVRSYRAAGILTHHEGFVIKVGRATFQVTVQS
jgi:hypothetical protein